MNESTGAVRAPELTRARIDRLFSYQAAKPEELRKIGQVNNAAKELANSLLANVPPGPELNEAIWQVREAAQTAILAIAAGPE